MELQIILDGPVLKPGDLIFEDVSKDGIIDGNDRILVDGMDAPEIFYGASLDASWKDFTLSVLIQGQGKYMQWNYSDNRRGEAATTSTGIMMAGGRKRVM